MTSISTDADASGIARLPWPAGLPSGVPLRMAVRQSQYGLVSPPAIVTRTFTVDEIAAIDAVWAATAAYGLTSLARQARVVDILSALGLSVPLAGWTDVSGAYGLRRLIAAYCGPLVRIRRSTDGAELDIWWDATGWLDTVALLAFCGSASAYVTRWYDQARPGYYLWQTAAGAQARLVNAGVVETIGGHPALYLDGNCWYQSSLPELPQPYSCAVLVRATDYSIGTHNRIFQNTSVFHSSNATGQVTINAGSDIYGPVLIDGTPYGIAAIYNGASSHIRANSDVVTGNAGTGKLDVAANIFTTGSAGSGIGIKNTGSVAGLVFMARALTTAASADLVTALGSGRGISA